MKQPPAFQFYPDDFVGGTAILNAEETGGYILLLCYQWSAGGVPNDDNLIRRIAKLTQAFDLTLLKSKFRVCEDGLLRNDRMERERCKQIEFREKQRKNGELGGRPKGLDNPSLSQPLSQTEAKKSSLSLSLSLSPISYPLSPKNTFDRFWHAYPRKVAKPKAFNAWKRHGCSERLEQILKAVEQWKPLWIEPQFIPHPATWLNGHRWNDPVPEAAKPMVNGKPAVNHVIRDMQEMEKQMNNLR